MRSIGTLFFDLDGTLTDPRPGITTSIRRALERMDVPPPTPAELNGWIGPPLYESFFEYLGSAALAGEALERYRDRFGRTGMYENDVYPGIPDALAGLARHADGMYVVTSKPSVYAQPIIEHFDLERYFRRVYGSELDGTRGDKTALIRHVLTEEGIPAERATMVGDRRHDIVGARENGVRAVGVTWGYGSRRELEAAGAEGICDEVGALSGRLLRG